MSQRTKRPTSRARSTRQPPSPGPRPVNLPKPKVTGGRSFLESLRRRQTIRAISDKRLSAQTLSNLLWAACGVNRSKGPFGSLGITAASASNSQEIDLFVALKGGVYLYEARHHRLLPVHASDLRAMAISPGQKNVAMNAPVQLIYVVDIERLIHTQGFQEPGLQDPDVQKSYYYVDTGLIAGNVYLFAASQGLAAWFHNCDRAGLSNELKLRPGQRVLFSQTVGYADGT
ncbi:MAG: nitroreductase family protein [Polyangiaceae bacterium]